MDRFEEDNEKGIAFREALAATVGENVSRVRIANITDPPATAASLPPLPSEVSREGGVKDGGNRRLLGSEGGEFVREFVRGRVGGVGASPGGAVGRRQLAGETISVVSVVSGGEPNLQLDTPRRLVVQAEAVVAMSAKLNSRLSPEQAAAKGVWVESVITVVDKERAHHIELFMRSADFKLRLIGQLTKVSGHPLVSRR
jgi:hypothetical protein